MATTTSLDLKTCYTYNVNILLDIYIRLVYANNEHRNLDEQIR